MATDSEQKTVGHTPGPWAVGESDGVWVHQPLSPSSNVICDIVGRAWDPKTRTSEITPEDLANARLIAAAPDLLRAAGEMYELLYDYSDEVCKAVRGAEPAFRALMHDLRHAIAKAQSSS